MILRKDIINEKKVESYFSVLKSLKYTSVFSLLGCEYLDLLIFVDLGQQHGSWHMELLRMHSLMNWIEKDKLRKKSKNMEKKENSSNTNSLITSVLIHYKLRK